MDACMEPDFLAIVDPWVTTLSFVVALAMRIQALELSKQVQRLVMVDFPRALPTQTLTWSQIELIIYCLNLFITN